MAVLTQQRRRFTFAAIAMAVVCILGALYLIAPVTASSAEKQQQLLQRQQQLRQTEDQTRPIQKLPELVSKAQSDIKRFYAERLPAFPSTVYNSVYELARKNNVALSEVRYEAFDTNVSSLQLLQIEAKVSGNYANIVHFINAVERNKLFFVIDGLQLSEQKQGDNVQLTVRMETYLRPRAPNEKPMVVAEKSDEADEE